MASGTLQLSSLPGKTFSVNSNSCADVSLVANAQAVSGWTVYQCSSDPIVKGSILYFKNPQSSSIVPWTVTDITATANQQQTSIDLNPLISTVIVCAYVFLFCLGFHSGVIHGNR